jgi:hypothetical protein
MRSVTEYIKENEQLLLESIPWRSGETDIKIGKTSLKGHPYDCIIISNLKFVMQLKPSMMIVVPPPISWLANRDYETPPAVNGHMIIARDAQQLEYSVTESGKCYVESYFFGASKGDRSFDTYQRIFEKGFTLKNFTGLKTFKEDDILTFSYKKKDYSHQTLFTGKKVTKRKNNDPGILIPVRIKNERKQELSK